MSRTNQNVRSMRAWQRRYDAPTDKIKDLAPDFELGDVDRENPAPLSDFRGEKSAILIFDRLSGFGAHFQRGIYAPQSIMEHGRVTYANGLGPFRFKPAEFRKEEE